MWLSLTVAGTVSVTGVAINIATDLKTSVLAWTAVAIATVTGGVATWAATSDKQIHRSTVIVIVIGCVCAGVLATIALVATSGDDDTAAAPVRQRHETITPPPATMTEQHSQTSQPTATPAGVIQDVPSYKLVSASLEFCPTSDKVDLDTARSGYGGQTQIGDYVDECQVEGGLAEIILEQDKLHTPNNSQLLFVLGPNEPVGYDECSAALQAPERLRSSISLGELQVGDHLCVKTDLGNIAQLTITNLSRSAEAEITIAFVTWR